MQAKSTLDILRQLLVFQACKVKPLVTNADALLAWSKRVLGEKLTYGFIRPTFYKQVHGRRGRGCANWPHSLPTCSLLGLLDGTCPPHMPVLADSAAHFSAAAQFVAGETSEELEHAMAKMRQHGVGGVTVFERGRLACFSLLGRPGTGTDLAASAAVAACPPGARSLAWASLGAGEDAVSIQPTLRKMKASGVRAILDYAAVECMGQGGSWVTGAQPGRSLHPLLSTLSHTLASLHCALAAPCTLHLLFLPFIRGFVLRGMGTGP